MEWQKQEIITADADFDITNFDAVSVIYPQANSVNRDDSTSAILTYGNVFVRDFDDATNVYSPYVKGKGLYETYYKGMIEYVKI